MDTVLARILPRSKPRRLDIAKAGLVASVAGSASVPLSRMLPDPPGLFSWLVDLATHWQWLYLGIALLSAVALAWRHEYRWSLPSLAVIALSSALWSPTVATGQSGDADALTIVSANLHVGNRDTRALRAWVRAIDADIVVVQEVSPAAAAQLQQWADYPHRLITPDDSPFGLAILSRHPLVDSAVIASERHTLHHRTFVHWRDETIALAAIHPMPPVSPHYHALRTEMLKSETQWAKESGFPAIVAGDMNATPWSSSMHAFSATGLKRATGLAPTWPGTLPVIPIDHILANAAWEVRDSGTGPDIGSDHRPVFAVLARTHDPAPGLQAQAER